MTFGNIWNPLIRLFPSDKNITRANMQATDTCNETKTSNLCALTKSEKNVGTPGTGLSHSRACHWIVLLLLLLFPVDCDFFVWYFVNFTPVTCLSTLLVYVTSFVVCDLFVNSAGSFGNPDVSMCQINCERHYYVAYPHKTCLLFQCTIIVFKPN